MQIYTKILIGMGVGAAIGLLLGPKSPVLEKDTYKIADSGKVSLLADPADPGSTLPLPSGVPMDLEALETRTTTIVDAVNESHVVPSIVKVRFEWTKQLALKDKTGALETALGGPHVGDEREAWLPIEAILVPDGGIVLSHEPVSGLGDTVITWLRPVGKLFMKLIQMVIVPLVFASLLVGVAGLGDVRKLGRLGSKTLGLYLCTTALAVTIGIGLAHLVQPGSFVSKADKAQLVAQFEGDADSKRDAAAAAPSAVENLLDIVPENPVASLSQGNMLQIIFFALIFGIALTLVKESRSKEVVAFFDTVQQAMIIVIHIVMALAPFGVAALIAEVVGTSGLSVLKALVVYSLTVLVGLALLATVVYGGLVVLLARCRWLDFMRAVRPAQLIAFSTSSSSATLPITLECAEDNLGISKPVSSFVIPLGSTVNMDGTALYQGVAAIFIAQVFAVDLSLGEQLGIVLAATMASIGAAGVPGAGMITLAMVLTAAGIPTVGVALILGVDRLLDMFRTAVNVTGDLAVASVMAVSEGETLRTLSPDADAADPDRGFEGRLDRPQHAVKVEDDAEDGS
jgi:Na+/H+-dicarboxylate symporter